MTDDEERGALRRRFSDFARTYLDCVAGPQSVYAVVAVEPLSGGQEAIDGRLAGFCMSASGGGGCKHCLAVALRRAADDLDALHAREAGGAAAGALH